jgi:hypothetical protein
VLLIHIDKANPRRKELTKEEQQKLQKLTDIAETLRRGEKAQNRQLQRWLSDEEYSQIEAVCKNNLNRLNNS